MIITVYFFACSVVIYASFCRLSMTDNTTLFSIRFAVWFMGATAVVSAAAPFYGFKPTWLHVIALLAMGLMQVVTRRVWLDGCPVQFRGSQR